MLDASIGVSPQLSLNEEQIAVRDMARFFAAEVSAPHAVACDEAKHFPVTEMRRVAELGMGGIYRRRRLGTDAADAALIFEALATGWDQGRRHRLWTSGDEQDEGAACRRHVRTWSKASS